MYDKGEGVTQDYKQAFKWFTKSAELGNTDAQRQLKLNERQIEDASIPQESLSIHPAPPKAPPIERDTVIGAMCPLLCAVALFVLLFIVNEFRHDIH